MRHLASVVSLLVILSTGCGGSGRDRRERQRRERMRERPRRGAAGGNFPDFATGGSSASGAGAGKPDGLDGTARSRTGCNGGYYNPSSLDDVTQAKMGMTAGANSERMKLGEVFLDQWGDQIRVPETKQYLAMGMQDLVCFVVGADTDHSNAPAGGDTDYYSPKNLYEPIFTDSGDVNPNNYWAAFMERVVKNYGPYVHQWEIWNEPDQVGGNWQATETWDTEPPKPSDLIWWNDTILLITSASCESATEGRPQARPAREGHPRRDRICAVPRRHCPIHR